MTATPSAIPPAVLDVVQRFLAAAAHGDEVAMHACLTQQTIELATFNHGALQGMRAVIGEALWADDTVIVPVRMFKRDSPSEHDDTTSPALALPCVVRREDDAWKLDLVATLDRLFIHGDDAPASAPTNSLAVQALGTAMQQVTQSLGTVMAYAFGELERFDANFLKADPSYADEELLPLPAMTPLPKQSAALSFICREPVTVSAAIDDMLAVFGESDRDALLERLDDELFEGWGSMFALLNQRMRFAGRLRGIRIEPACDAAHRTLMLDGSQLLYRLDLRSADGVYGSDVMDAVLPGILVALPPEVGSDAHRLVQLDHEVASMSLYRQRVVPRMMRRISELVGRNVVLELDVHSLTDAEEDARQLYRWGLNRVVGGVALACLSYERRMQLHEALTGIRLRIGSDSRDRYARFAHGVLEVSIFCAAGEAGAFFERDLDRVLAGELLGVVPAGVSTDLDDDAGDGGENSRYGGYGVNSDDADDDEVHDDDCDDDDEDDDDDDVALSPAEIERGRALNDENFRSAAAGLRENEAMWAMQVTMVAGHEVTLTLDFDSLGGRYERVQPFIHQGLTATLEAFTAMWSALDSWRWLLAPLTHLVIAGAEASEPCVARFADGTLTVRVPLEVGDVRPPTAKVSEALTALATGATQTAPAPLSAPASQTARTTSVVAPSLDPYAFAAQFVVELEQTLRDANLWPGPRPPDEIEVKGAFGMENMAFNQWLAWVLIPRVEDIVATRGDFPDGSNVAAHAVREWDGYDASAVFDVLYKFDQMVNGLWS